MGGTDGLHPALVRLELDRVGLVAARESATGPAEQRENDRDDQEQRNRSERSRAHYPRGRLADARAPAPGQAGAADFGVTIRDIRPRRRIRGTRDLGPAARIADKPRFVAAMFGRIAPRYDLMNTRDDLRPGRALAASRPRPLPSAQRRGGRWTWARAPASWPQPSAASCRGAPWSASTSRSDAARHVQSASQARRGRCGCGYRSPMPSSTRCERFPAAQSGGRRRGHRRTGARAAPGRRAGRAGDHARTGGWLQPLFRCTSAAWCRCWAA